jgi:cytochrome oxidase Cu insertion factor (SCO1/SenC/PrrC family)
MGLRSFQFTIVILSASMLLSASMAKAALRVGDAAPDFALPDQNGKMVRLKDFRGKRTVVLAFYVRAGTPG